MGKYWPIIASLVLAIAGLWGDTFNEQKKRLTTKGIIILVLSVISFSIAFYQQHREQIVAEQKYQERKYIALIEGRQINEQLRVFLDAFYLLGRPKPSAFSRINSEGKSNIIKIDSLIGDSYWERISSKNLYNKMWDSTTLYGTHIYDNMITAKKELEAISLQAKYFNSQTIAAIYKVTSHEGLKYLLEETKKVKDKISKQTELSFYTAMGGSQKYKDFMQAIKSLQQLIDSNNL